MPPKKLTQLTPAQTGTIYEIKNDCEIRRRLQDIGFVKGTKVRCMFSSPLGDPTAYRVKGTTVALRYEDASKILIE